MQILDIFSTLSNIQDGVFLRKNVTGTSMFDRLLNMSINLMQGFKHRSSKRNNFAFVSAPYDINVTAPEDFMLKMVYTVPNELTPGGPKVNFDSQSITFHAKCRLTDEEDAVFIEGLF